MDGPTPTPGLSLCLDVVHPNWCSLCVFAFPPICFFVQPAQLKELSDLHRASVFPLLPGPFVEGGFGGPPRAAAAAGGAGAVPAAQELRARRGVEKGTSWQSGRKNSEQRLAQTRSKEWG